MVPSRMKESERVQKKQPIMLEFITVSNPNEGKASAIRTRVKKHVMKDIGLSRRKPKKNPVVLDVVLSPRSRLGSSPVDVFAGWPIELGEAEHFWVSYIFREYNNPQKAFRNEWFSLGQTDKATFQIILSNSAAHVDQIRGVPHGQRGLDSERYHLAALQSLNQRLTKPDPEISDGIIGAVTGFIMHNEIIADFEQWQIHLQGLIRLVNLRGGIDSISLRELRETISWIETRGCLPQDRRPFFPIPPTWFDRFNAQAKQVPSFKVPSCIARQWSKLAPSSVTSAASYGNLFRLSAYVEKLIRETKSKIFKTDDYAGGWTNVLIHTLLSRYDDCPFSTPGAPVQEAIRLATLLYIVSVWRRFGVGPIRTCHLAGLLLDVLDKETDWRGNRSIQAWTMLMGVIETGELARAAFLDKFRDLATECCMSVHDLAAEAKEVLWIEGVFPTVDTILETDTMDWTMERCLTENTARLPWDIATRSLETRQALEAKRTRKNREG